MEENLEPSNKGIDEKTDNPTESNSEVTKVSKLGKIGLGYYSAIIIYKLSFTSMIIE